MITDLSRDLENFLEWIDNHVASERAHLQEEARLQEADGGGEAELDDRVRELPRALLAHSVAREQPLRICQHRGPGDHAPVRGLLLQVVLLMLLRAMLLLQDLGLDREPFWPTSGKREDQATVWIHWFSSYSCKPGCFSQLCDAEALGTFLGSI